jgi:protein arginine kinase activator
LREKIYAEYSESNKTIDHFAIGEKQCPDCGMKFVEFRNGGRFGCPHDYETFSEDLIPLLEGVHGTVNHTGKIPKNQPKAKASHNELTNLRKKLQNAIDQEKYEEAAALRDQIRQLETY